MRAHSTTSVVHCPLPILLAALFGIGTPLSAGDWPQILGPNRNGIASADERLADKWPKEGPPVVWERSVGSGYAGLAVVGERAVLFHRLRSEEVVETLDPSNGRTLWKQSYPTSFYPQVGGGDGPLCVPTIADGRAVTFGAQGVLSCYELASGNLQWQHQTHKEYRAPEGYFGAGSAPLIVAGLVIVNVGGDRQGAGIVAFDLATGTERWKTTTEQASYSAPTLVTLDGEPHVLMVTRLSCLLLDAKTGALRFQFPFGQRGPTVNGATPLVWDDHLFLTASYGTGAVYAKFDIFGADKVWEKDEILSSQYTTPILIGESLYGIHGRDDIPPADLKCIDPATGRVNWVDFNFGYATLLAADGKLIAAKTDGELVLIRPSVRVFQPLARARVLRGTLRALPALSQGRLLVRDEKTLKCLDVSAR